jgi:lactose/L-arabinose transport system permease protein
MYTFLCIAAFVSLFPLFWMVVSATNTSAAVLRATMIPGLNLLENFRNLTASWDIMGAFWNSTRNAVVLTLLSVLICSFAGYGFEVFHSKAKDRLMRFLLLSMMIPFAAIMIPLFTLSADMGLLRSSPGRMIAFILPTLSTAFLIMLFRQSARYFPHDMLEAARIDGLNEFTIFFRIFMPTMKSTYAAAIVITFMAAWNSYLWPVILFRPVMADHTLPLVISNIMAGYVIDNGVLMLAVLITTLPAIIVFFMLQRYFAEGIVGSIK